jgi:hypothetical protein
VCESPTVGVVAAIVGDNSSVSSATTAKAADVVAVAASSDKLFEAVVIRVAVVSVASLVTTVDAAVAAANS